MQVIFIHGPAAAGKFTIGTILSERTGLPLFHNHLTVDLAKALFDFGSEEFNRLRAEIWRSAFREAAAAMRSFIFTFHPEATVDPELIVDLVAIVEQAGGRVHFVELACSTSGVLERLDDESRTRFGKLTDKNLYVQIKRDGGFDFPPLPAPIVRIDTEMVEAGDAATAIENALSAVT